MVRLADMSDDQYDFEEEKYRVIGHYTGKEYRMGQKVFIRVISVDKLTQTIDFAMMDETSEEGREGDKCEKRSNKTHCQQ